MLKFLGFWCSSITTGALWLSKTVLCPQRGTRLTLVLNSVYWRHVSYDFEILRILLIILNNRLIHRHEVDVLRIRQIALCRCGESEEDQDGVDEFHCIALLCAVVFVCFVELIRNSCIPYAIRVTKTTHLLHLNDELCSIVSVTLPNLFNVKML